MPSGLRGQRTLTGRLAPNGPRVVGSQVAERREPPGRVREKMRGRRTARAARAVPLQTWGHWAQAADARGYVLSPLRG